MTSLKGEVRVRRARLADARRVAELSGQLGYPATERQMKVRLRDVIKDKEAACFVALSRDGELIGWIHVSTTPLLEVERRGGGDRFGVGEGGGGGGARGVLFFRGVEGGGGGCRKKMSLRSYEVRGGGQRGCFM